MEICLRAKFMAAPLPERNVPDSLVEVAFNGVVVLFPHITIVVSKLGSPFPEDPLFGQDD